MKNVNDMQIKKCIFKELDEFKQDVAAFFGNDTTVECYDDGIVIEANEDALYTEEILAGLAKYYDVKEVTSIHIDDCEVVGLWIVYKD